MLLFQEYVESVQDQQRRELERRKQAEAELAERKRLAKQSPALFHRDARQRVDWTDELIEMVKALWAEGHSASDIARAVTKKTKQTISRNAVIGKLHRLRLNNSTRAVGFGVTSAVPSANKALRISAARKSAASKAADCGGGPLPRVSEAGRVFQLLDKRADPYREPPPDRAPLVASVQALEPHHCRWPIGMPSEDGFGFCGCQKAEGSSYCAEHQYRAMGKNQDRRDFEKAVRFGGTPAGGSILEAAE